jgi:hypothetical protein
LGRATASEEKETSSEIRPTTELINATQIQRSCRKAAPPHPDSTNVGGYHQPPTTTTPFELDENGCLSRVRTTAGETPVLKGERGARANGLD